MSLFITSACFYPHFSTLFTPITATVLIPSVCLKCVCELRAEAADPDWKGVRWAGFDPCGSQAC